MTLRQQYDIRGFKAADEFFGEDGQEVSRALLSPRMAESYL